jgi:hypothetical protein
MLMASARSVTVPAGIPLLGLLCLELRAEFLTCPLEAALFSLCHSRPRLAERPADLAEAVRVASSVLLLVDLLVKPALVAVEVCHRGQVLGLVEVQLVVGHPTPPLAAASPSRRGAGRAPRVSPRGVQYQLQGEAERVFSSRIPYGKSPRGAAPQYHEKRTRVFKQWEHPGRSRHFG